MYFYLNKESDLTRVTNFLRGYMMGETVYVQISHKPRKRSQAQNNTHWMWLAIIAKHIGMLKDELHDWAMAKNFGVKYVDFMGIKAPVRQSSSRLSRGQFSKLLNTDLEFAAFNNITLPMPDDKKELWNE